MVESSNYTIDWNMEFKGLKYGVQRHASSI